jgi:hypothetical protein
MPRDGAIIFADLLGKLECCMSIAPSAVALVAIACNILIEERGRNAKLIDWLHEITANMQ